MSFELPAHPLLWRPPRTHLGRIELIVELSPPYRRLRSKIVSSSTLPIAAAPARRPVALTSALPPGAAAEQRVDPLGVTVPRG